MVYLNRFRSIAALMVLKNGPKCNSFVVAGNVRSSVACFSTSEATGYWNDAAIATDKVKELYDSMRDMKVPTIWKSREEASEFVTENIDTVLFDCDGVLYRTQEACPGAKEALLRLESMGKKILFVTNNAGVNRQGLRKKLSKVLDIPSLTEDQMVSSSYSSARYLVEQLKPGSRIFVIGSAELRAEVESAGFTITNLPDDLSSSASMDREELEDYEFNEGPIDAIVIGHDTQFTFRKLSIANNLLLQNPDALLVATNHDSFDIVGSDNRHIPGNGCVVKAVEYCSGRQSINVGKPSKMLSDLIAKEHDLDPTRCLFIGDRLDTDIRFGNENGMKSLLVMSGVTTAEKLRQLGKGTTEEPLPHYVLPHVGMLI
ncbi:MAG: hypothetical protein SGBAC_011174 [Bacillariaceae sp.]